MARSEGHNNRQSHEKDLLGEADDDTDPELARTVRRLLVEFGSLLDTPTAVTVLVGCRRDLHGSPPGAQAELVERLARQRLREMLPLNTDPATP